MAEVTDGAFRKIAKRFGAGLTFTQMVSARGVIQNDFDTLRYLVFHKSEKPIGVQILANNPDYLSDAIKDLQSYKPDVIDLNCGCPVPKVTQHHLGSSILDDPTLLRKLVAAMKKSAGDIPISVKMRLGRDKKNINILENAKVCEGEGASYITVHARTRACRYDDEPRWEWLTKIKNEVSIPIVGNGSVFEPQNAVDMMSETGCDSVMIARGALGNPFLFSRYNSLVETGVDPGQPDVDEVKKIVMEHIDLLAEEYGEDAAVHKIKKHFIWYFKSYNGLRELLDIVFSFSEINAVKEFAEEHTEKIKNGFYPVNDKCELKKLFKEKVLFWLMEEAEV